MITIKTVLKSGGEYKPEHVLRMRDMICKFVNVDFRFVCYSDVEIPDVAIRPLINGWKGWWSKIEMFRDIEESFYIDLDMTVQGNITDMVTVDSNFIALHNMNPRIAGIGSAMMKWRGDKTRIYHNFLKSPLTHMQANNRIGTPFNGDQGFLWRQMDGEIEFFQQKFPDRIKRFDQSGGDIKVYFNKRRPWK